MKNDEDGKMSQKFELVQLLFLGDWTICAGTCASQLPQTVDLLRDLRLAAVGALHTQGPEPCCEL